MCQALWFPRGSDGNVSSRNAGDLGSIPGSGRAPGEGNGNPLQYSCLENSMDGGAWWATVHWVTKSWTQLSNFTFTFKHCVNGFTLLWKLFSMMKMRICRNWNAEGMWNWREREMATHSSILAWRIMWTEETGGLPSMGSHRVGQDWSNLACMHALEKEMATQSRILAWRIPGTEEPGGLPSMGSYRVGHNWSDLAAAAAAWETGSS